MAEERESSVASSDSIDILRSSDEDDEDHPTVDISRQPILVRGVGQITVFGLNSRFDTEFPQMLTGRVAPEELTATLSRVNAVLRRHVGGSSRWLLCGLLFCCCSFGCSLWPVICLNRRTVSALEKTLDAENQQLYHKLGLHWRLATFPSESSHRLNEYVLILDIMPKAPLLLPD